MRRGRRSQHRRRRSPRRRRRPRALDPGSGRRLALKETFVRERGYWSPVWDDLLRLDPDFFAAYTRFSSVPWRRGVLEPKHRELVYVAIDAATTHLFEPGVRIHVRNALAHGASIDEILAVLELTALLGVDTFTVALPILLEELQAAGHASPVARDPTTAEAEQMRRFRAADGDWSDAHEALLKLDNEFFAGYADLAAAARAGAALDAKTRALIQVAVYASATHLHAPGIRAHVASALRAGATTAELLEVLQLASVLGIHSISVGVPILVEELQSPGDSVVSHEGDSNARLSDLSR